MATYRQLLNTYSRIHDWPLEDASVAAGAIVDNGAYPLLGTSSTIAPTLQATGPLLAGNVPSYGMTFTTGKVLNMQITEAMSTMVTQYDTATVGTFIIWVKGRPADDPASLFNIGVKSDATTKFEFVMYASGYIQLLITIASDNKIAMYMDNPVSTTDWEMFACTSDGIVAPKFYQNGTLVAHVSGGSLGDVAGWIGLIDWNVATICSSNIGARLRPSAGGIDARYAGGLSQCSLLDVCLTAGQLAALYDAGINGLASSGYVGGSTPSQRGIGGLRSRLRTRR